MKQELKRESNLMLANRLRVCADLLKQGHQVPTATRTMQESADALESQRRRIAALEAVLEPLAAIADCDIGHDETDNDLYRPMQRHNKAPLLTVGHLRKARAVLRDKV